MLKNLSLTGPSPLFLSALLGLATALGFFSCAKDPPMGVGAATGGTTAIATGGTVSTGGGGRTNGGGATGTGCIAATGAIGAGGMTGATGGANAGGTSASTGVGGRGGSAGRSAAGGSAGGSNAGGAGGTAAGEGGTVGVGGAAGTSGDSPSVQPFLADQSPALPWLHVDGNKMKDENGDVVILRGVDFPDLGELQIQETTAATTGAGINAMIDRVTKSDDKQGGCSAGWATRVIRLAVSPVDGMVKTPLQYMAGGTYYDTVLRPTVDYARQKGLYVIIDWHYIDDTTAHENSTTAFWTDMAPRFANDSNVLFELYNEPINQKGSWPSVKADMQTWYDVVRQSAPKNLVLVGTPSWSQLVGTAAASPITGTNVVYVAHMYPQHWANTSLRAQITQAAALVPVFVTEWGFHQDPTSAILNGTITSYGAPFKQFIQQMGASWTAWCASRSWEPTMFATDFTLTTGETEMGTFVKDWLYEQQAVNQVIP